MPTPELDDISNRRIHAEFGKPDRPQPTKMLRTWRCM